jgi:DNA polymerase beta thumb
MRLYAKKQLKISLSDTGMWRSTTDPLTRKTIKGERIGRDCATEHDIFKFLGLEYKAPSERSTIDASKVDV